MARAKVVAVTSVKGGVGKTLISINLALRLSKQANSIALIDADIDNSNFAQFTGVENLDIMVKETKKIYLPRWRDNIKIFSMSLLVGRRRGISITNEDAANIVTEAMKTDAMESDIIIIDMPPGAGTIFRKVLETAGPRYLGSVIVSQPAMIDSTTRSLDLHTKLGIPILGLVENMSYIDIDGKRYHPFGMPIGEQLCETYGCKYYGSIPLILDMYEKISRGEPYIESDVLDKIAADIIEREPPEPTWLEKIKDWAYIAIKENIDKLVASIILKIQREIDLTPFQREFGFTDELPFELNIVSHDYQRILTSVKLKITGGKLKVLQKDADVAFKIYSDLRTLARMLTGVYRTASGELKPYDPVDAWVTGRIRVVGEGFLPKAIAIMTLLRSGKIRSVIDRFSDVLLKYV